MFPSETGRKMSWTNRGDTARHCSGPLVWFCWPEKSSKIQHDKQAWKKIMAWTWVQLFPVKLGPGLTKLLSWRSALWEKLAEHYCRVKSLWALEESNITMTLGKPFLSRQCVKYIYFKHAFIYFMWYELASFFFLWFILLCTCRPTAASCAVHSCAVLSVPVSNVILFAVCTVQAGISDWQHV